MPQEKPAYFRTKARTVALQALYATDVAGHPVDASLGWLEEENQLPEASALYARELMQGVIRTQHQIDELITKFAPAWPVKQLPVIDRNILRLALFEIRFGHGIPRKVAINEAVELAKTFGSESSPRFVNGVLGSVMDELEGTTQDLMEPSAIVADHIRQEGK